MVLGGAEANQAALDLAASRRILLKAGLHRANDSCAGVNLKLNWPAAHSGSVVTGANAHGTGQNAGSATRMIGTLPWPSAKAAGKRLS